MTTFNSEGQERIGVVGVCLDSMWYRSLSDFLETLPGGVALGNLEHYIGAEREVGRALDSAQVRVCAIDYDHNAEEAAGLIERLRDEYPDMHLFVVSASSDREQIISAMRLGCAEYLLKPMDQERVLEALSRAQAKQKRKKRSKAGGKVVTLIGAKGGSGVTSLALHLSLALSNQGERKCLLIDQHPVLGDASLYLGTGRHQYSFYELANNRDRLDEELLKGFILNHPSGLDLLDAPEGVDAIYGASGPALEQTLAFLAEHYQFVLVDCPPGFSEGTLACIAQSSITAIVMTADLPSVRNAARYLDHLGKLGYPSNRIQIVLNRYSKKGSISDDSVETTLGRPISVRVPNSYSEVIRAINTGAPITSDTKSDFSKAIRKWALDLAGSLASERQNPAAAPQARSGVWALFG